MAVTVKLKYLRHSPRKLRSVTRLFAGKKLELAINETLVMPQDSAMFLKKALLMARAAAKEKEYDTDTLVIKGISAVEGPKIKRMRPTARGRASKYEKHLAHLMVTVDSPVQNDKKIEAKVEVAKPTVKVRSAKKVKE